MSLAGALAEGEGDAGSAQLVDSEGNVVTVSSTQLAEAGIDINNITDMSEHQLQRLIHIATTAQNNSSFKGEESDGVAGTSSEPTGHEHVTIDNDCDGESKCVIDDVGDLTMVIGDDGSLRLIDAEQQEFLMSGEQLRRNKVDVNNLTEEQVQAILKLAMQPQTKVKRVPKRPVDVSESVDNDVKRHKSHTFTSAPCLIPRGVSSPMTSLIGETVDVGRDGTVQQAIIRYARRGAGYKVQYKDGRFEWVPEQHVTFNNGTAASSADHRSYTNEAIAQVEQHAPKDEKVAGFACPICERKVENEEPAFIVIRLPACSTCAESKIMILDKEPETLIRKV